MPPLISQRSPCPPACLLPSAFPADLATLSVGATVPPTQRPQYCSGVRNWTIGVLPGPQADPDYFAPESMETFYSTAYKIHHNS